MYGILQALYSDILCSGILLSGIHFYGILWSGILPTQYSKDSILSSGLSTDSRLKKVFYQPGLLKIFFYQDHPHCALHYSKPTSGEIVNLPLHLPASSLTFHVSGWVYLQLIISPNEDPRIKIYCLGSQA